MVSQSVDRVLKAESDNTELLEQANEKAAKIVQDARNTADAMLEDALQKAKQKSDDLNRAAQGVIDDIYAAGNADTAAVVDKLKEQINKKTPEAVALAVKILTE